MPQEGNSAQWKVQIQSNVDQVLSDVKELKKVLETFQSNKKNKVEIDIAPITKKIRSLKKNLLGLEMNVSVSKKTDASFETVNEQIKKVKENLSQINTAFSNANTSGLTEIKETLTSLDNVVSSLVKNIPKLNNIQTGGNKQVNRKTIDESDFLASPETYAKKADSYLKNKNVKVLGKTSTVSYEKGFAKVSAKIKDATGAWKTFSAKIDGDGKMFNARFSTITKNIGALEEQLANPNKGGKTSTLEAYSKQLEKFDKEYIAAQKKLNNLKKRPERDMSSKEIGAYKTYKNAVEQYEKTISNRNGKNLAEEAKNAEILANNIKKARQEYELLNDKGSKAISRNKLMDTIGKYTRDNTNISGEYKSGLKALMLELKNKEAGADVEDIANRFFELKNRIRAAGQEGQRFFDLLNNKVVHNLAYQLATLFSFNDIINGFRQGIQLVRELDSALTELRKVSDDSLASLQKYQKLSFDIANDVGSTGKQMVQSTADWRRLGESQDEAKESAKASNILLSVSEFENIDDATQALVSMSSAYKELSKMDIIDVVNKVGNNFSVSTDKLSEGIQNAGAALITQGNDIYKSAALLTAANAIPQDMSKASSGVRTIALRLAGTEEAKAELTDLGEDVEDYIVQTKSKTQELIKNYTAVASNNGKGIDVLDSNGNLRDTYDILLDISKIYKEIQDEDKKAGTNRANALVEAIAGKNRSNIAASILQNPKLLEDVYNSAMNSKGSAQNELETALDSVDAKFKKLENEAQRFWYTFISSDSVKTIAEFLADSLNLITKIVDKMGTVPTLLTAIAAGLAFKNVGRTKSRLHEYAYSDKVSYAKYRFYISPSVQYTVEFADMVPLCIWVHPLMIEGREVA